MNQSLNSTETNQPELSIVIPALNEEENIAGLVEQITHCMRQSDIHYELIIVDDGSSDGTLRALKIASSTCPQLKLRHRNKPMGQSAAMHAGIQAATGRFIATLDADLQNDPADLPRMLAHLKATDVDMIQGDRSVNRQDNLIRKFGSRVGRTARRLILGDSVRDTGCSARVVRSELAKQFPLQYKGIHRFLPIYAKKVLGARVLEMPVSHYPRHSGQTKYGLGLFNRAFAGLVDCFALRWMTSRYRNPATRPINRS